MPVTARQSPCLSNYYRPHVSRNACFFGTFCKEFLVRQFYGVNARFSISCNAISAIIRSLAWSRVGILQFDRMGSSSFSSSWIPNLNWLGCAGNVLINLSRLKV